MSFKKLVGPLLDAIKENGIDNPTSLQEKMLPKIKSGANLFGIGPDGAGKTTTLIIGVLQKLKAVASGDNPRALIFVKDKKAALKLKEQFEVYTKQMDLRIYCVYEEQIINHQKDGVYAGTDIVIATPKRLSKLYFLNGINLTQLQMIVVEDAEFLIRNSFHTDVDRISESIAKCQHLVFAKEMDDKLARLKSLFMAHSQTVKVTQ
jgi:superfamily II DNA/RNA helicase